MDASPYNRFNSLKVLVYADRLQQAANGGLPYPIDWHIYPSNFCNHSCSWCMFRQNGEQFLHKEQLSEQLLLRAIADAKRTGAKLVEFSGGGEPLLNRHTKTAIAAAAASGLAVALNTNGSLLSPELASQIDYIRISLNAGTEATHQRVNHANDRGSDWTTIIANIQAAARVKKKDLGLGFVLDHQNVTDIIPFCEVAASCGVDFVHIRPAFWYDKDLDAKTRNIVNQALDLCNQARRHLGHRIKIFAITEKFDGFWTPRNYNKCLAIRTGAVLTATGDFAVCQDRTDLRFGATYRNGASFEDVWHSDEHKRLLEQVISPGLLDQCPRCVWNKRNEIIQEVFIKDEMRLDMI